MACIPPAPLQAPHGLKNPVEVPLEPRNTQPSFLFQPGLSLFNRHRGDTVRIRSEETVVEEFHQNSSLRQKYLSSSPLLPLDLGFLWFE